MTIARPALCAGALALLNTVATAAAIYRCETAAGLVFSDRPCAADAAIHESHDERVTVYDAPSISKRASEPRAKPAPRPTQKHAKAAAKHQEICAKLDRSLREVRTKLRTGYGVKEGERLKARQRELAEKRRTEKCR